MGIQITIVGLGQIGASIGLALKDKKDQLVRVGHDIEIGVARQAEKMGAIDRVDINLPHSVQGADLVVLALPLDQMRETLQIIAPDLRENCVVIDTGPAKEAMAAWATELLPEHRHYVGLTPLLNSAYLHSNDLGIKAAHADLFQDGLMAIAAPPRTDPAALQLASDLTRLLGATPLFSDLLEVDGLTAATHLLPQLMAAALLNATIDQPGWREGRKFAGSAYAKSTAAAVQSWDANSLAAAALSNRNNALRVLDGAIAALYDIRNDLEAQDESALEALLKRAYSGRQAWWKGRQSKEWMHEDIPGAEMPTMSGMVGRLFGIGKKPKTPK